MRCFTKSRISVLLILTFLIFSIFSLTGNVIADQITELDSDGDGLSDEKEEELGTNATDPDSDGDGLTDGYEVDELNSDPLADQGKSVIYGEREEVQDSLLNTALFTFLMAFAVFALLAGAFTAYFGAGKSRAIGSALMVIGLVVILFWIYFGIMQSYPDDSLLGIVHWDAAHTLSAFVTVLAAFLGAIAAIGLFLIAIMKS